MRRVVLKEALAKHWDTEPAVATLIQRARDNTVVESYLQSVSKPPDSYPSEAELQTAYDARKSQLLVPGNFGLLRFLSPFRRTPIKPALRKPRPSLKLSREVFTNRA